MNWPALEAQQERLGGSSDARGQYRSTYVDYYRETVDLLVEMGREHGSELEGGVLLGLKVSQSDFARLAVGSRQRVNGIFREWEKSGLVEHRNDRLWIREIAALEEEIVPFE